MINEAKTIFFNHHSDFKVTAKQFTANGKRYSKDSLKGYVTEFFKRLGMEDKIPLELAKQYSFEAELITDAILHEKREAAKTVDLSYLNEEEFHFNRDLKERAMPIKDIILDNEYLLDRETRTILPASSESLKAVYDKKEYNATFPEPALYKVVYSVKPVPKMGEIIYPQGPVKIPQANLYRPPRWRFCEDKRESLHPDHERLLRSRFLNEESLERYGCVMYHTITDRSKNICGLVHNREGTGKSTVMGKLPSHLVGIENATYTDHAFMASPHKDAILNKRVAIMDEHKLTKGQSSIEKKFVEEMIYINPKGKPAMTVPNTLSWFMTSNHEGDIYTEPSNRRHYFLEDSGRHIVEEFGIDWVREYNEKLWEPEFIANLGYWILNTFKDYKYPADAVYKGPTFERVVRATCFPGYETIIEQLLAHEVVDCLQYSELKKDYNRKERMGNKGQYFPRPQTFIDFFKDFTWGGKRICRVDFDTDGDVLLYPVED